MKDGNGRWDRLDVILIIIGFIADVIGIWGAITSIDEPVIVLVKDPGTTLQEIKILTIFSLSDFVIGTLFLTLFVVTLVLYFSLKKLLVQEPLPAIIGLFASIALVGLYFRLWLGPDWWILVGIALCGFVIAIALVLMCSVDVYLNGSNAVCAKWFRGDFANMR